MKKVIIAVAFALLGSSCEHSTHSLYYDTLTGNCIEARMGDFGDDSLMEHNARMIGPMDWSHYEATGADRQDGGRFVPVCLSE